MAHSDGRVVRTCLGCGTSLGEGEYARVHFTDPASPSWGYYCKNRCEPIAESKSKEEARVALSDIPAMIAFHHYHLTRLYIHDELADTLTRDYHAHLLSIATVGNPPEQPTEGEDDGWISVHDRMPESETTVLIWLQNGYGAITGSCCPVRRSPNPLPLQPPEMEWYDDAGDMLHSPGVTHWQPLPGKPKGLQ